jgi:hypothetical protein
MAIVSVRRCATKMADHCRPSRDDSSGVADLLLQIYSSEFSCSQACHTYYEFKTDRKCRIVHPHKLEVQDLTMNSVRNAAGHSAALSIARGTC